MKKRMPKTNITVVKVPLDPSLKIDKPAIFPPMPEMFLELFENKNKLRRDYVNKGYKDNDKEKTQTSKSSKTDKPSKKSKPRVVESANKKSVEEPVSRPDKKERVSTRASSSPDNGRFMGTPKIDEELTRMIQHTEEGFAVEDDYNPEDVSSDDEGMVDIQMLRRRLEQMDVSDDDEEDDLSDIADTVDEHEEVQREVSRPVSSPIDSSGEDDFSDDDEDSLMMSPASEVSSVSKYKTPRDKRGYVDSERDMRRPKRVDPAPYNSMKREEEKRELLFKFDMLRKSYPGANIRQDFTIKSDLDDIKTAYEMNVRRLSMDSTVEKYKSYLMAGFMATEYAFGHFLGLDMQGYTQQQILQMSSYEKLLIEIGEKSYVPNGVSKFPVEVRLLFLVIMNAAIFIGSKMLMAKTGANILNMVNSMNNFKSAPPMPSPQPQTRTATFGKRKMRGPTINANDL
jgi:hypothetical protein